jgi:hypothetical protein
MTNNREKRIYQENVHLYLALYREGTAKNKRCFRQVIKDEIVDLKIVEEKCKVFGGTWRIHKTVNARNCEKARKILLKMLIDHPEKASVIDSEWRTALMQKECRVTNYFMLDIDSINQEDLDDVAKILNRENIQMHHIIDSPKGVHVITDPFDTREVCKLEYVTLLRDGYYYIKTVGE